MHAANPRPSKHHTTYCRSSARTAVRQGHAHSAGRAAARRLPCDPHRPAAALHGAHRRDDLRCRRGGVGLWLLQGAFAHAACAVLGDAFWGRVSAAGSGWLPACCAARSGGSGRSGLTLARPAAAPPRPADIPTHPAAQVSGRARGALPAARRGVSRGPTPRVCGRGAFKSPVPVSWQRASAIAVASQAFPAPLLPHPTSTSSRPKPPSRADRVELEMTRAPLVPVLQAEDDIRWAHIH